MNNDITFCASRGECDRSETCKRAHPPEGETVYMTYSVKVGEECDLYMKITRT